MQELVQLMEMLGGRSTPPAMGGPQPPVGTNYPFGAMGGNEKMNAALQGIGAMQALQEMRKFTKASSTVGMQLDKPTRVDPMSPGVGPADIQARAQRMGAQQSPQGMPPGMPPGGPPGMPAMPPGAGAPPPGGMPPGGPPGMPPQGGAGGGIGAMLAQLMAMRGGR